MTFAEAIKLKQGDTVSIYCDPVTEKDLEGNDAIIEYIHNLTRHEIRMDVTFPREDGVFYRSIIFRS